VRRDAIHPVARRRAFTLAEMVVALVVAAVVLLAAQSAILMASKAVPTADSPPVARVTGAAGLGRLLAEVSTARTITAAEPGRVTFTVADRDADGLDEKIEYSWSGTPGDPVSRTENDGPSEDVIPGTQDCVLSFDTESVQDQTVFNTSAETVLSSYSGLLSLGSFTVTNKNCIAQQFTPSLPSDATGFIVTRATLKLAASGAATGTGVVRLLTAWGGVPTTRVVDGTPVLESGLASSFQSVTVSFSGGVVLPAGTPLALVVQCDAVSPPCDVQQCTLSVSLSGQSVLTSTDGGQTWGTQSLKMLPYVLYGKVITPDTSKTITRVTNVRCAVRAGKTGVLAQGNAELLNRPVAP